MSSAYSPTALRAAAEVSARRSAIESPWKRIASTACSPLALTRATTSSAYSPTALRAAAEGVGESIGDQIAMEADRFDGLFAACADARDDRRPSTSATALRAAAEVSASRSAMESPWKRIAATACSPLALTRATTSSAYSPTALRVGGRGLGKLLRDSIRHGSGLLAAACSPLALTRATTSFVVFGDSAACRLGSVRELVGDRIALGADRVHGLRPACADAADNLVRVSGDSAAHRGRRPGKLGRDRHAVRVDGLGGLGEARGDDVAMDSERLRGFAAAGGNAAHDGVRMGGDGVAR